MAICESEGRHPCSAPVAALLRALSAEDGQVPSPPLLADGVSALLESPEWAVLAAWIRLRLSVLGADAALPAELSLALRRAADAAIALSMGRRLLCRQLAQRAEEARLPLMALKGAALSGWVYPWSAPRIGADIDLLVRREDAPRFGAVFAQIAIEEERFNDRPALRRLAFERAFICERPMRTTLDLHLHLTNPALYAMDAAGIWERSRPHPGFDSEWLRVPAVEDMLLHLALHALYDLKAMGRHDFDTARLVAHNRIDWTELADRAHAWGAGTPLYLLLRRTQAILDTPVPTDMLTRLRPSFLRRCLARRLLAGPPKPNRTDLPVSAGIRGRQLLAQLTMSRSPWAALAFQWRYLHARLTDTPGAIRMADGRDVDKPG